MFVQIVNLNLEGLSEEDYHALGSETAEQFASLPGLLAKVWLKDIESNTYGGVYLWENEAAYRAAAESELFEKVRTHPNIVNLTSQAFDVYDDLTAITSPRLAQEAHA